MAIWSSDSQSEFNEGTYNQTFYNTSGFVQLNTSYTNGSYTSKIFDAGADAQWNNISWTQGGHYGQELPYNKTVETGFGRANMTGNILLMHMNEQSGIIADYSGEGNDGTAYGDTTYGIEGKLNTALSFDGNGDYVDCGTSPVTGTMPFTLEAWIKTNTVSKYSGAISIGASSSGRSAYIGTVNTAQVGSSNSIGGGFYGRNYGSGITTTGEWVHLVMTFSGGSAGTAKIYVNGIEKVNDTYTPDISSSYMRIGRIGSDTIYDFNGVVDEATIYNRSLSAEEIKEHYLRGILRLNLSVRSCDDSVCSGEGWVDVNDTSPQNLSDYNISNNQYFQYKFKFNTENNSYSPKLYNVSIDYIPSGSSSGIAVSLISPSDGTTDTDRNVSFICNATTTNYLIDNITLYIWNSTGLFYTNTKLANSSSVEESWNVSDMPNEDYEWNCLAYNNLSQSSFASSNNSLTVSAITEGNSGTYIKGTRYSFFDGTLTHLLFNDSTDSLALNNSLNGTFTSQIFNAASVSQWSSISWCSLGRDELPNNKGKSCDNSINMTGNTLLMHMNEQSGTIVDYSGEGNNGTVWGNVTYRENGKFNTALGFLGDGDHIESNSYTYYFNQEITLGAWFKINGSGTGYPRILEISKAGDANSHCLAVDLDGSLRAWAECDDDSRVASADDSNTYNDGKWHLMVYTYSNPAGKLYVDGVQTASASGSCSNLDDGSYLILGAISNGSGAYSFDQHEFDGYIDEVFVFNRSLAPNEILEIYKRGALRLNLSVRSCDDSVCSGEGWVDVNDTSPQNLSDYNISNNQYFQYKFEFNTENNSYSPKLYNVSIDYSILNHAPEVVLNSPDNDSTITSDSAVLSATVYDSDLNNMTVWFYGGYPNGTYSLLNTSYNAVNGSTLSYNWKGLQNGKHNWSVVANDGIQNSSITYYFFTIENPPAAETQQSKGGGSGGATGVTQGVKEETTKEENKSKVLFDIKVELKKAELSENEALILYLDLINLGSPKKTDVQITYNILDLDKKVLFHHTETRAVSGILSYKKVFAETKLKPGEYIIQITILYGDNQKATAEHRFTVTEGKKVIIRGTLAKEYYSKIALFSILGAVVMGLAIVLSRLLIYPLILRMLKEKSIEEIIRDGKINKKVKLTATATPFMKIKEGYLSKLEDKTGYIYALADKKLKGKLSIKGIIRLDKDKNRFLETKKYKRIKQRIKQQNTKK